jgi:cytochrome c-L
LFLSTIEFRNAFDGSVLDVRPPPGHTLMQAVQAFHTSGHNPYSGDTQALAAGRKLYQSWCQSCHLPDGSGRMGPSLIGDSYGYEGVATDVGMFEVVFGGAGGAMQAFGKRISQDGILKIIAYVRSLKNQPDRPVLRRAPYSFPIW